MGGMSHYQAFVGESREGTETKERMARLISMGLAEVVKVHVRVKVDRLPQGVPATISERGQGAHRYAPDQGRKSGLLPRPWRQSVRSGQPDEDGPATGREGQVVIPA